MGLSKNKIIKVIFLVLALLLSSLSWAEGPKSTKKMIIIGDSLTEGYGVAKEEAFPAKLEKIIKKNGHDYEVINGGVSGSTSASGLSRLKWFLKAKPALVILALGANDGLRGIEVEKSKENLEAVITRCQKENIPVVLAGMQIPPNYGKEYTQSFKKMYEDIGQKYELKQIPFLLEGVAGVAKLNLEDGIHPNPAGYDIVALTVYKNIKELL